MIFILEDEIDLCELITYTLSINNLESKSFLLPSEFLQSLNTLQKEIMPNLILLDVMLPEQNGFEVLKTLKQKQNTKHIPIILLSAKNNEIDKVKGLNAGADDYIIKPFGILELLARINALLRRTQSLLQQEYNFREIYLNTKTHTVCINKTQIFLTRKEFQLLTLFLSNLNLVFSKEQLLESIWGENFQTRTIDVHINTLRQKLGKYGCYIQTIRGIGYKLA